MATPIWQLTVQSEFCSAHALRHYRGKCEHLHGHNYGVKVVVEGGELAPDTELLMDFGDLKSLLKEILEGLDHKFLNDIPPFDVHNPSAENLARHIWKAMEPRLPGNVKLVCVNVAETGIQSATYMERE